MKYFLILLLLVSTAQAATLYGVDSISGANYGDVIVIDDNYVIDDTITIPDGVTITGTGEVKLADDVDWDAGKTMFYSTGDDITITGITIDGNSQGNTGVPFGKGYLGLFLFRGSSNVVFDDVTLEYCKSDGIVFRNGNGITVTNSFINKMGHEGLYSLYSDDVTFTNNKCFTRTNSAVRIASGEDVLIADNEIYSGSITSADGGGSSTGPGIELNIDAGTSQYLRDIEIRGNYIHDLRGSGIWMTSGNSNGDDVWIHDNVIENVGKYNSFNGYSIAGITTFQIDCIIENNVFIDTGIAAVRVATNSDSPNGNDYTAIVKNNIIVDMTHELRSVSATTILNEYKSNNFIQFVNNNMWNAPLRESECSVVDGTFYLDPMLDDDYMTRNEKLQELGIGLGLTTGSTFEEDDEEEHLVDDEEDNAGNDTVGEPNSDVDNSTYEHEPPVEVPVEEEPSLVDNSTYDYVDNDTWEYEPPELVDNSTYDYVDNSSVERHRSKRTGHAFVREMKVEAVVGAVERTKPTFIYGRSPKKN